MFHKILALGLVFTFISCSSTKNEPRTPAGIFDGKTKDNFIYSSPEKLAWAPSAKLDLTEGEILFDNYRAYLAKINLIRKARESLDLVYYIYSSDVTSSLFSHELIQAAKRGVRVRLLVDSFSAYPQMDLFRYLQSQGVQVKFYNLPTRSFILQAIHLTTACPESVILEKDCADYKNRIVNELQRTIPETESFPLKFISKLSPEHQADVGMYLSGLFAKNPLLMFMPIKENAAPLLKKASEGPGISPEQKEGLKKLAKLLWDAKTGTLTEKISARFKLLLWAKLKSEEAAKVDEQIGSFLPFDLIPSEDKLNLKGQGQAWAYLTAYTHHKLLLADGKDFVMGGRNIEDSYHVASKEPLYEGKQGNKYLFWDTDFIGKSSSKNKGMLDSFSKLWNFAPMALDVEKFYQMAPNDFAANSSYVSELCKKKFPDASQKAQKKSCVRSSEMASFYSQSFKDRSLRVEENMMSMARVADDKFEIDEKGNVVEKLFTRSHSAEEFIPLKASDFSQGQVFYLENLHWDRSQAQTRKLVTSVDKSIEDNRNIQAVWKSLLANACRPETQNRTVIINNAYFFPSSDLIATLANMLDGTWDCRGVTIYLLTNSFQTTDLNVINLFAKHSIAALAHYLKNIPASSKRAKLVLKELSLHEEGRKRSVGLSLHSKVFLAGDDLVIGSANWDVRSQILDTNNAIWFHNNPKISLAYRQYFNDSVLNFRPHYEGIKVPNASDFKQVVDVTSSFGQKTASQILEENMQAVEMVMKKFGLKETLDKKMKSAYPTLLKTVRGFFSRAYNDSYAFLRKKGQGGFKLEGIEPLREGEAGGFGFDLFRIKDNSTPQKIKEMNAFNEFYKLL